MAPTLDELGAKPGDLLEIFRPGYKHWAVYIGDGYVVHLASLSEGLGSDSMTSVGSDNAVVKKAKYSDVVGRSKCRVNNLLDDDYEPQPADVVVRKARALVGRQITYHLLQNNCEHFATHLRYGVAESRQAFSVFLVATIGGIWAAIAIFINGICSWVSRGSGRDHPRDHPRRQ